jgi:hypothetical protein
MKRGGFLTFSNLNLFLDQNGRQLIPPTGPRISVANRLPYKLVYLPIYIRVYRNLRTQHMSVLVLLCTSYATCFGPYWWPSSGGFVTKNSNALITYTSTETPIRHL